MTKSAELQQIKEVILDCQPIFLSSKNLDIIFQTKILDVEDDKLIIQNSIPPYLISKVVSASKFSILCQEYRLCTMAIQSNGKDIIFPVEDIEKIAEGRKDERFHFDSHEHVVLELLNPYDKQTVITKPVLEMSSSGLSIRTPNDSKLFSPKTKFSKMKILIDGKLYNQTDSTIIYKRKFLGLDHKKYYQIGFKFE